MDADTFIVMALEGYALLVTAVAAVVFAVARHRHPDLGE
jgi:hypothetical protein